MRSDPLALILLLTACTRTAPQDDDSTDDEAEDDDSAAGDDDTTPQDACTASSGTFDLQITGAINETHPFSLTSCEYYNGDVWRISYDSADGWIFRIITGPLVEGQEVTTGHSVSLVSGNTYSFTGRSDQGLAAGVTAQTYQDEQPPCGLWTTSALHSATLGDVQLATQPFNFRCP